MAGAARGADPDVVSVCDIDTGICATLPAPGQAAAAAPPLGAAAAAAGLDGYYAVGSARTAGLGGGVGVGCPLTDCRLPGH